MKNVVAAVMRDRKHEMASMSKALARVELLRKRLDAHGMGKPAVKHEVVVTVHSAGGQKISPAKEAVERATARALLIKSKELKKRSAQGLDFKSRPDPTLSILPKPDALRV